MIPPASFVAPGALLALRTPKIIVPRDYQDHAVDALWRFMQNNPGKNPVIVMPTGTGKSIVIGAFMMRALQKYPSTRIMCLTHVKELIGQNASKLELLWPSAPYGVHSAGLKQRDVFQSLIFGGVQTVRNSVARFPLIHILLIDECFSPDTEILTERGFIRFDALGTERVAQYDVGTKQISFTTPTRYIRKPASDGLLRVKSAKAFDCLVTPGHDMIVNGTKVRADRVVRGTGRDMPVAGRACGFDDTLQSWERFAIAYQADGSLHRQNKDGTSIVSFTFKKQRKIDAFISLIKECKYQFNELDTNDSGRRRWMVYLPTYIDKTIDVYFNISTMSFNKCRNIIEYMNIWDGHVCNTTNDTTYLYTTTNKRMADFYQAVATLAGYRSNCVYTPDDRSETFSNCYMLFVTKHRDSVGTQSWDPVKVAYTGDVYCVSVPTGAIVTRRGGKVIVTGNCHLLSPNAETSYWEIINALRAINPKLVVVGFTATDYRRNQGRLTDGEKALFNGVAIDMSTMEWWSWFIANGYLVPPVTRKTATTFSMAKVGVQNGDYKLSEMNAAVDDDATNLAVCNEISEAFSRRHKGLIFCAGVEHAEHISGILNRMGIKCVAVHTRNEGTIRDRAIREFLDPRSGLDMLTNNNVLTTGFDAPMLDYIGMARPTVSTSLWVQMLGRGTRPYGDPRTCDLAHEWRKYDVLVDDFAGNTVRLGPVNDPVIPKPPGSGPPGEAPVKLCPKAEGGCACYVHASARLCPYCGHEFVFKPKIVEQASHHELYRGDLPIIELFNVQRVFYTAHTSRAGNDQIRVQYHCGSKQWSDYINFERSSYTQHHAREWWRQFVSDTVPLTNNEALEILNTGAAVVPRQVRVHVNRTPPEIKGYEF